MKALRPFKIRRRLWATLLAGWCGMGLGLGVRGEAERTQTIRLEPGWNAIFLEVDPPDPDPAVVFAGLPVDIVAACYNPSSSVQFVTDPGANLFRQSGWGVWYAAERPDAFLKTLHGISGQRAYLVHALEAHAWEVRGTVRPSGVRWQAGAFNLAGFSLHLQAPPTFAQFFAGSAGHQPLRVYRLAGGVWQRVVDPAATPMRSGEAFWIYCGGASTYQGPLRVETPTRQGLVLGENRGDLVLRNATDHPVRAVVEHVPAGGAPVPLALMILATGTPAGLVNTVAAPRPEGAWSQELPPLEGGQAIRVPFQAQRERMQTHLQESLLKISTDVGTEVWIPVYGIRPDLKVP